METAVAVIVPPPQLPVSPFGVETIADRLASREGVSLEQARELLMEIGLEDELELFDGEDGSAAAREELERGASKLSDELRMSMDYYGAQEGVTPIERVVVCGLATDYCVKATAIDAVGLGYATVHAGRTLGRDLNCVVAVHLHERRQVVGHRNTTAGNAPGPRSHSW